MQTSKQYQSYIGIDLIRVVDISVSVLVLPLIVKMHLKNLQSITASTVEPFLLKEEEREGKVEKEILWTPIHNKASRKRQGKEVAH